MKRRSVGLLFGSWVAYWAIVALVKLGPAAMAIWRSTRTSEPNASSVSFNIGNWVFNLIVTQHGQATWSGSVHLTALAGWIAGVPLVMWLVWLMWTRSVEPSRQAA